MAVVMAIPNHPETAVPPPPFSGPTCPPSPLVKASPTLGRRVRCLDCGARFPRADYAADLEALNPNWPQYDRDPAVLATADRPEAEASTFKVAPCPVCGGLVKPDVVFFGESLPASMGDAMEAARECEVALVAGSSLVVSTGMWIVRQAYAAGATLAIINYGPTAADTVADIRIDCGVSPTLTALADALC